MRAATADAFAAASAEVERLAGSPTVDGVTVGIRHTPATHRWRRPMPPRGWWRWPWRSPRDLGFELRDAATGGASDANTTAALGLPTLDGLGPVGGDDHSADEWLDLASVAPRTTLLAMLIGRIGEAL